MTQHFVRAQRCVGSALRLTQPTRCHAPHHHRVLVREDDAWVADVPDLKSCSGPTPEEAVAEVRVATDAWLAAAPDAGHPIPQPRFQPQHEAAE
jgi:predicted RNase H-like HicB family nuclease